MKGVASGFNTPSLLLATLAMALLPGDASALLDPSGDLVGPDDGGYRFIPSSVDGGPEYEWEDISQVGVNLLSQAEGDDLDESTHVLSMPFPFEFYGTEVDSVHVSVNGVVHFNDIGREFQWNSMKCMPTDFDDRLPQEGIVAALWADLAADPRVGSGMFYTVRGTQPNRRMILQWHNMRDLESSSGYVSFQSVFYEGSGDVRLHYKDTEVQYLGSTVHTRAYIGVQGDPDLDEGISYLCNSRELEDEVSLLLTQRWDEDGDGSEFLEDCNDDAPTVYPGAEELCDEADNDCDGTVDEGAEGIPFYPDGDGDGFGSGQSISACSAPAGYSAQDGDCNDDDDSAFPGASEYCDEVDNNCDGVVDNNALDASPYYYDWDEDGYGDEDIIPVMLCAPNPTGATTATGGDCDDDDEDIYPGAIEICNRKDDDCNGVSDDDPINPSEYYYDGDGDEYGLTDSSVMGCEPPVGYTYEDGDCQDSDPLVNPGRSEVCNRKDDDCNGVIDDNASDGEPHYPDSDSDAFPAQSGEILACADFPPAGFVLPVSSGASFQWDCDDNDSGVFPGAQEICNGKDDDCDQRRDEGFDVDGDSIVDCEDDCPADPDNDIDGDGFCANDDNCPAVPNPGQEDTNRDGTGDACTDELCDGLDNDGDGLIDEGFADTDDDGLADCVDLLCLEDPLNDADGDGICGQSDNCPDTPNEDQLDEDDDGLGDECDVCFDIEDDGLDSDLDGWPDACDVCPDIPDAEQGDADGDGVGDRCEDCALEEGPDGDGDGFPDSCDVCPDDADDQADGDGDGVGDVCDVCVDVFNSGGDSDDDGWPDECDVCPDVYDPDQEDSDGDGLGDACTEEDTPSPTPTEVEAPTPTLTPTPTAVSVTESPTPTESASPSSTPTGGVVPEPPSCGSCNSGAPEELSIWALLLLFGLPLSRRRHPPV